MIDLEQLLKMQYDLDTEIVNKYNSRPCTSRFKKEQSDFLTERLLAVIVEFGELANATRCFKYWSLKPAEPKERLIDEYADCLHFLLSIGNTLEFTAQEIQDAYFRKYSENIIRQMEGY